MDSIPSGPGNSADRLRRRLRPLVVLAFALGLILPPVGPVYALWHKALSVQGTVETGRLALGVDGFPLEFPFSFRLPGLGCTGGEPVAAPTGYEGIGGDHNGYSAYTFLFEHSDGSTTTVTGSNAPGEAGEVVKNGRHKTNDARLPGTGGATVPGTQDLIVHVSCSDSFGYGSPFPDGWGEKAGPDAVLDPEWRVAGFAIARYDKNGNPRGDGTVVPVVSGATGAFSIENDGTIPTRFWMVSEHDSGADFCLPVSALEIVISDSSTGDTVYAGDYCALRDSPILIAYQLHPGTSRSFTVTLTTTGDLPTSLVGVTGVDRFLITGAQWNASPPSAGWTASFTGTVEISTPYTAITTYTRFVGVADDPALAVAPADETPPEQDSPPATDPEEPEPPPEEAPPTEDEPPATDPEEPVDPGGEA